MRLKNIEQGIWDHSSVQNLPRSPRVLDPLFWTLLFRPSHRFLMKFRWGEWDGKSLILWSLNHCCVDLGVHCRAGGSNHDPVLASWQTLPIFFFKCPGTSRRLWRILSFSFGLRRKNVGWTDDVGMKLFSVWPFFLFLCPNWQFSAIILLICYMKKSLIKF